MLDVSGDGKIDRKEMLMARQMSELLECNQDDVAQFWEAAFLASDANKDGDISCATPRTAGSPASFAQRDLHKAPHAVPRLLPPTARPTADPRPRRLATASAAEPPRRLPSTATRSSSAKP